MCNNDTKAKTCMTPAHLFGVSVFSPSPDSCWNQPTLKTQTNDKKISRFLLEPSFPLQQLKKNLQVDVAHGVRASACATPISLSASSNPEQGSQLRRSDCAVSDIFLSVSASLNKQTWQVMQRFDVRSVGCTLGCPRALQPLDKRAPQGR